MATLKNLTENIAERFKKRDANIAKQRLERARENEHIGNELAKHDINSKFAKEVDSGDHEGTLKTRVTVPVESQRKAHDLIHSLGYHKTHYVSSETTAGGRFERRPGTPANASWQGD